MPTELQAAIESAEKRFLDDLAGLRIGLPLVEGRHGLVAANLQQRIVRFRRPGQSDPFCEIYIPGPYDYQTNTAWFFSCPALKDELTPAIADDFTAVMWFFYNILERDEPIDIGSLIRKAMSRARRRRE